MPSINRRQVLRTLASASLLRAIPATSIAAIAQPHSTAALHPPNVRAARTLILDAVQQGAATGVAVAVIQHGKIVWEEGFGWANRAARLPVTPHTPFTLASITKPFTATALMTLAAKGQLSLDEPANRYLANSEIKGDNFNLREATVRLLGAHASGLPTLYAGYRVGGEPAPPATAELLKNYGRLAYPPGACYEYSNIGYTALAAIASKVTHVEFGTLLTEKILRPLGLRDSFFGTMMSPPYAAKRYSTADHEIPFYTTATPASGELYASAHDLALFALFNMKNAPGNRILEDKWLDEPHRPVFVGPSGVATTFGWFLSRLKSGIPVISKIGGQPGVATALYTLPSENLACLVLTNRSDGRGLCDAVCNSILRSYLPEWQQPEETCSPRPETFAPTPVFQRHWKGHLDYDGANLPITLNLDPDDTFLFAIADKPTMKLAEIRAEGTVITGVVTGQINSPDALRTSGQRLMIKLLPYNGMLVGRVLATFGDPNIDNVILPYVVSLRRV